MFDPIIAVDAGYAALVERGIALHHAFGDFDSARVPFRKKRKVACAFTLSIPTKTSPIWTLRSTSRSMKDSRISSCVTASMRVSIDLLLANLQLMAAAARKGQRVWGVTEEEVVVALDAEGELNHLESRSRLTRDLFSARAFR